MVWSRFTRIFGFAVNREFQFFRGCVALLGGG
jgi:hypothetical protein